MGLDNLRSLADRVAVAMREYAYNGWALFLPLNVPERAPQIRMASLTGQDRVFLEGMRLTTINFLPGALDYWRIYEVGIANSAQSYWEDTPRARNGGAPYLSVQGVLWRLHSILTHARLAGQETPGVQQVLIGMDWRGLGGRTLKWGASVQYDAGGRTESDRFFRTVALPWAELRDSYFQCFRRIALSFLDVFPVAGLRPPAEWLTRDLVEKQFSDFNMHGAQLFDD